MRRPLALALACLLAACEPGYVPDAARAPAGAFGEGDQDLAAVNVAQYAFMDSGRLYGRPADGARAVAAIDYLAGQFAVSSRWSNLPDDLKGEMLSARDAVRQAAGIAPDAPSQLVVDRLTRAYRDLAAGDRQAALADLTGPAFTLGPDATLRRLGNMPYLLAASTAAQHAFEATQGEGAVATTGH